MRYRRDFNGYQTFSTTTNTLELSPKLSDVERHPIDNQRQQWLPINRKQLYRRNGMRQKRNLKGYPTFSTMADSLELVPTLSDVGQQPCNNNLWLSVGCQYIGQCWQQLQRVSRGRKCLVSVEISLISHTVPELLLLPVYRPPLLFPVVSRDRTMSGLVPVSRPWSKMLGSL